METLKKFKCFAYKSEALHQLSTAPIKDGETVIFMDKDNDAFFEVVIVSTQKVWLAIDKQDNFLVMIENLLLRKQTLRKFALNEGFKNHEEFIAFYKPKLKKHQFYKGTLELTLMHWTNFRYLPYLILE